MRLLATRRYRRSPLSLSLEPLEVRTLMAADFGIGASAAAQGSEQAEGASFPRFASEEQLRQELLEAAVERYKSQFGQPVYPYWYSDGELYVLDSNARFVTATVADVAGRDHSNTNVQTDGVDEADLVKTDGNYIYFVDGSTLVIIDTHAAAELQVVSRIELPDGAASIYLFDDRLTVISQRYSWNYYDHFRSEVEAPQNVDGSSLRGSTISVAVYDVSDRTSPQLVTETAFEGDLVQSRMIGSQIYLVTQGQLILPGPQIVPNGESETVIADDSGGIADDILTATTLQVWPGSPSRTSKSVYESETAYRARVGDQMLETALPKYATYDAERQFERGGRISNASNIYDRDLTKSNSLVSVLVFDATGSVTGPQSSTTVPAGYVSQIYSSLDNLYVVEQNTVEANAVSDIYRFAFISGGVELASIGEVPGNAINQFSLDEYDGHLRVATQSGWGESARSAIYVLELSGMEMDIVGRLENLMPGERLYSSRFVGDRGFLVTSIFLDPLLAIDLSDPTHPELRGELEIPGFSNYLQIVDDHYLIGFGRDADIANRQFTDPQVSIFDVADLDNPVLVDRFLIPVGRDGQSDAFADHHAISYFADQHVLAIPMNTSRYEIVQDGQVTRQEYRTSSQMWVFKVDPTSTDALQSLGTVDLDAPLRRSVRIEDELYSIAGGIVQANRLEVPGELLGQVTYDSTPFETPFTIDRFRPIRTIDMPIAFPRAINITLETPLITETPVASNLAEPDVNGDGAVTPLDVLLLVNRLNSNRQSLASPPSILPDIAMRLGFGAYTTRARSGDIDGNGRLDALDVLRVVNRLNERAAAHDQVFASL